MELDLKAVKLVAFDMDGTLLNDQHQVSKRFFELFEALSKKGVTFVAASGRQYASIKSKLNSISNRIYFVAENGAVSIYQDEYLQHTALDKTQLEKVLELTTNLKDTHAVVCGKSKGYLLKQDQSFHKMLSEYFHDTVIVDNLKEAIEKDTCLKISLCHKEDAEQHIFPFVKHLEPELKVKVSGKIWVDISKQDANKGNAIKILQKQLNISAEECMAFGDYSNDIEMLESVKYSFAMENAHPSVKNIAKFQTLSNNNRGVDYMLEELLEAKLHL